MKVLSWSRWMWFVGSNLATRLLKEDIDIILLDNLSRSDQSNLTSDLLIQLLLLQILDMKMN